MSAPMTVTVAAGGERRFAQDQRAAWASLPRSLTEVAGGGAELAVVDGAVDGWPLRVEELVRSGVRGLLLARPRPSAAGADVRRVDRAARDAGVPVVVDRGWAAHPAVSGLGEATANGAAMGDPCLVDSVVTVPLDDDRAGATLLLEQLALVRAVLGPVATVEFATGDRHGYTVDGRRGGCIVALSAVRSAGPAGARLTAYAAAGEVHLEVTGEGTAAPATVWRVDGRGQGAEPTWYESGVRASWRRLVSAVREGRTPGDLGALADDLDLLSTVGTLEP